MPAIARTTCLICGSQQLRAFLSLTERGTPHGAAGHQHVYDYTIIGVCADCEHGQLETFSHDCFSHPTDEDWDMYWWYALAPADVDRLTAMTERCPDRLNAQCNCAVHRGLRESSGRLWGGVRHAVAVRPKAAFAWLRLQESAESVTLTVDKEKGLGSAA